MLASIALLLATVQGATDIGWELVFQDQEASVDKCFPSTQQRLNGTYIITSGGKFGMGKTKLVAIFDAFGKIHKFDFRPDQQQICYKAKMMATGYYNESVKENTVSHGILFVETVPPRTKCIKPMCNVFAPNDNTYVNNIRLANNTFCSLTDTTTWTDFDIETLTQFQKHPFTDHIKKNGHVGQMGPAHPLQRPGHSNTWISLEQQAPMMPGGKPYVTVFSLDGSKPDTRVEVQSYLWPTLPYFHSFGVHEDFALVIHQPVYIDFKKIEKDGLLGNAFTDLPTTTNKFVMVPFDGGKPITYNSTERFFHLHTVNTFRDGNDIVVDGEVYEGFPYNDPTMTLPGIRNKTIRDSCDRGVCFGMIKRYRIDTVTGEVALGETLSPTNAKTAFPVMNPRLSGKPYCFYWAVEMFHNGVEFASYALVKHDMCGCGSYGSAGSQNSATNSSNTYWYKPNHYQSEVRFVPSEDPSAAEDSGTLVFIDFDGVSGTSYLVTIDATMKTVETTALPVPVPFMLHGEFHDGVHGALTQ